MAARIRHQHTTKPAHNRSARKKAAAHTSSAKSRGRRKSATSERWSQRVTKHSNALDLKQRVFTLHDPKKIAASLKRSAERSTRRKASPYRSALSMLTFYINRGGMTLPKTQRERLERAKGALKRQFHREA